MKSAQNKAVEESSSEFLKPLDRAIRGVEAEFEEEIGLYGDRTLPDLRWRLIVADLPFFNRS